MEEERVWRQRCDEVCYCVDRVAVATVVAPSFTMEHKTDHTGL
jgi:hypothetical protein